MGYKFQANIKKKKAVEAAWCNSMFPGADKIRILSCFKIKLLNEFSLKTN